MTARSALYTPSDVRNRRSSVRIVSHVTVELPTDNSNETFALARCEALKWVRNRAGVNLPDKAWDGQPFDLKDRIGAQPVSAVAVDHQWAIRFDDNDKEVPQRTWITEVSIWVNREREDRIHLSCRLTCRARGENPPYTPTVPGIVRQIADHMDATIDNRPLETSAWKVENEESVTDLIEFLKGSQRQRPVIVVSDPPYGEAPSIANDDLARLTHTHLLGVAHIVALGREASYALTDRVGEEFSVFNGAVRTYQAALSLDSDQPSAHPLALSLRYHQESVRRINFL